MDEAPRAAVSPRPPNLPLRGYLTFGPSESAVSSLSREKKGGGRNQILSLGLYWYGVCVGVSLGLPSSKPQTQFREL